MVEAEERLERKMSVILEEWEQCGHTEDTAPSFLEEIEASEHIAFLCSGVKFVVSANKLEKQRLQLVLLVHVLQRKGILNSYHVVSALMSVVSAMADMELWVDVPGLWRNLSQVFVEMLMKQAFTFGELVDVCSPLVTAQQHTECKRLIRALMERVERQGCQSIYNAEVAGVLVSKVCQVELPGKQVEMDEFLQMLA
jgi:hypothetical protein